MDKSNIVIQLDFVRVAFMLHGETAHTCWYFIQQVVSTMCYTLGFLDAVRRALLLCV